MTGKGKEIALWAISHLPTAVEAAAEPERQRVRKEVEPQPIDFPGTMLALGACRAGMEAVRGCALSGGRTRLGTRRPS